MCPIHLNEALRKSTSWRATHGLEKVRSPPAEPGARNKPAGNTATEQTIEGPPGVTGLRCGPRTVDCLFHFHGFPQDAIRTNDEFLVRVVDLRGLRTLVAIPELTPLLESRCRDNEHGVHFTRGVDGNRE